MNSFIISLIFLDLEPQAPPPLMEVSVNAGPQRLMSPQDFGDGSMCESSKCIDYSLHCSLL